MRSNAIKDVPIYMNVYNCSKSSLHARYALVVPSGMKRIQRQKEKKACKATMMSCLLMINEQNKKQNIQNFSTIIRR
jgi:hypothetical protein